MKRVLRVAAWLAFLLVLVIAGVMLVLQGRGVSARPQPSWIESRAALFMRGWMTPATYKGLKNPVSATDENFLAAREHFADHCASCHGNDGSGNTEMGRNLYPKAPDMRLPRTQQLSDGELFYIIENGVMLTGMPGWSTGTPEGENIKLAAGALHPPAAVVDAGRSAGDGTAQPAITRGVRGGAEDPGVPRWRRPAAR